MYRLLWSPDTTGAQGPRKPGFFCYEPSILPNDSQEIRRGLQDLGLTEPLIFLRVVSPVCKTGRPSSTPEWGGGITCVATTSPTRRPAAAPASTALRTAATSPRTIAVTSPASIFSQPTRRTFAAFIIATSPRHSIIPSASGISFSCVRLTRRVNCVANEWVRECNRLDE